MRSEQSPVTVATDVDSCLQHEFTLIAVEFLCRANHRGASCAGESRTGRGLSRTDQIVAPGNEVLVSWNAQSVTGKGDQVDHAV